MTNEEASNIQREEQKLFNVKEWKIVNQNRIFSRLLQEFI